MRTTWQSEVNWFSISEHARLRTCFERQRTGTCNCVTGKKNKYNPCERHTAIESLALAIGLGDAGQRQEMQQVLDWLNCYTCNEVRAGRTCKHRACDRVVHLMDFIHRLMRKAA